MKTFSTFNVIFHYPTTEDDLKELRYCITNIYVDFIINYISNFNCSNNVKDKLIKKLISNIKKDDKFDF